MPGWSLVYFLHVLPHFIYLFFNLFTGFQETCQWTYLFTVELIPLEISCGSLEKAPVSPLVVRDVSSHLVLNNFIRQENPFNPRNLQRRELHGSREGRNNKMREGMGGEEEGEKKR